MIAFKIMLTAAFPAVVGLLLIARGGQFEDAPIRNRIITVVTLISSAVIIISAMVAIWTY